MQMVEWLRLAHYKHPNFGWLVDVVTDRNACVSLDLPEFKEPHKTQKKMRRNASKKKQEKIKRGKMEK